MPNGAPHKRFDRMPCGSQSWLSSWRFAPPRGMKTRRCGITKLLVERPDAIRPQDAILPHKLCRRAFRPPSLPDTSVRRSSRSAVRVTGAPGAAFRVACRQDFRMPHTSPRFPAIAQIVGRTPSSAADPLVGSPVVAADRFFTHRRDEGVPRGPGGPPHRLTPEKYTVYAGWPRVTPVRFP
jgi:hypothetical protein